MPTPQFILDLRQSIGHAPLWLMGVTAAVFNEHHELLLTHRKDSGEWAMVYGIVEPGEEAADTVIREVKEEACVDCSIDALVAVTSSQRMITYPNGDQAQYMDHLFICHSVNTSASQQAHVGDDENLAVGWFSLDHLPETLAQSTVERLNILRQWQDHGSGRALYGVQGRIAQ